MISVDLKESRNSREGTAKKTQFRDTHSFLECVDAVFHVSQEDVIENVFARGIHASKIRILVSKRSMTVTTMGGEISRMVHFCARTSIEEQSPSHMGKTRWYRAALRSHAVWRTCGSVGR